MCGCGIASTTIGSLTSTGIAATCGTMTRKLKPLNAEMDRNIIKKLQSNILFIEVMDNNQKGHPLRHQRKGSSNKFVKVTGRCFREFNDVDDKAGCMRHNRHHIKLEFLDQKIPSMHNMSPFEYFNKNYFLNRQVNDFQHYVIANVSTNRRFYWSSCQQIIRSY